VRRGRDNSGGCVSREVIGGPEWSEPPTVVEEGASYRAVDALMLVQFAVGPTQFGKGRVSTGSAAGHCVRKLRSMQRLSQAIAEASSKAEQDKTCPSRRQTSTSRPVVAHQNARRKMR